jgi:hypothetical protein
MYDEATKKNDSYIKDFVEYKIFNKKLCLAAKPSPTINVSEAYGNFKTWFKVEYESHPISKKEFKHKLEKLYGSKIKLKNL